MLDFFKTMVLGFLGMISSVPSCFNFSTFIKTRFNTFNCEVDSGYIFNAHDIKTETITTQFDNLTRDCSISLVNQQQGFSTRNGTFNFDTFVTIEGHDQDICSVETIIASPDPDNIVSKIDLVDGAIAIQTTYANKNVRGFVSYKVKVPYATLIKLIDMNYGSITVDTINKSIENAKTHNGAITIHNITGDVHAQSNNGSIQLRNVKGETSLLSRNGKVTATEIEGSVDARSDNGSIEVHKVNGKTLAKSDNGSIHITSILGNVDAQSDNGKIMVNDITGDVDALSDNGKVTVTHIEGDVNAQSKNGSISLSNISHAIYAKTNMGSINHILGKYPALKNIRATSKMGWISYLNTRVKKEFSHNGTGNFTAQFVTDMGKITIQK